ncbi:hypothetical protein Nmel_000940 [Mimus melanotis]
MILNLHLEPCFSSIHVLKEVLKKKKKPEEQLRVKRRLL